jgi:hypothetical protein
MRGTDATALFLRLCLQSRWRPEASEMAGRLAARDEIDWARLLDIARAGGVAPLLYHAARDRDLLPPAQEDNLRRDYYATATRNVLLFNELEQALVALGAEDIPSIVLKGPALAQALYRNVALRPMGDIDLLVRERDVPVALRTLIAMGYAVIPPRAYRCEVMLRPSGRTTAPIELHWSLFVPFYYQHLLSPDWLCETALPIEVGDTRARMLGPEAQLLHLSGHLTLHHGSGEAVMGLWLYDVAEVIDRYGRGLDWDELLARAQIYGLVLSLQRVLPRVSELWQAPIPLRVLEQLDALRPSYHEERTLATLTAPRRSAFQSFLSELATLPGCGPRVRFAWRNLFPPPFYLKEVYGVPHRLLVPLAYPYRWLMTLWGLQRH